VPAATGASRVRVGHHSCSHLHLMMPRQGPYILDLGTYSLETILTVPRHGPRPCRPALSMYAL
jgi:hypothetical protein